MTKVKESTKVSRFDDTLSPESTFTGPHVTHIEDDKGNVGRGRGQTWQDADRRALEDLKRKQQDQ
jgi:hypothetical protein